MEPNYTWLLSAILGCWHLRASSQLHFLLFEHFLETLLDSSWFLLYSSIKRMFLLPVNPTESGGKVLWAWAQFLISTTLWPYPSFPSPSPYPHVPVYQLCRGHLLRPFTFGSWQVGRGFFLPSLPPPPPSNFFYLYPLESRAKAPHWKIKGRTFILKLFIQKS